MLFVTPHIIGLHELGNLLAAHQPHMPFVNNYIIGLGGTGGAAVAAFRRATVLRHNEYERLIKNADGTEGSRFQYLYIDSNVEDIAKAGNSESEQWQVPGGKISLSPQEIVCIDGTGFTKADAEIHPGIAPWLGDIDRMQHNVFESHLIGAGQRRRYGRMLFARKVNEIRAKLTHGIHSLFHGSTDSHTITFHIFASLGGGTGSGCLIDTIMLVHELTPAGRRAEVMLYLFVGGGDPDVRVADAGFLFPNEYCTLRDLNALMSGRWHPVMAGAVHAEPYYGGTPVTAVHISSDASHLAPNLEQQVDHTANACFDTISLMRSGVLGPVERTITGEDIIPVNPGECSNPANPESAIQVPPTDGFPERSYRFRTVGVSRCKVPVMEIRTILKDEFAAQVNEHRLKGSLSHRDSRRCSALDRENDDIYDGTAILPGSPLAVRCAQYDMEKLEAYEMAFHAANQKLTPESLINVNTYVQETVRAIEEETMKDLCSSEWQELCHDAARERMKHITQKLEQRSRWSGGHPHSEPIWGATDIAHYLRSLMDRLSRLSTQLNISTSLGNMEKREKVWHTIGALTKLLCSKKERDFEIHLKEGRAVIARALAKRREALSATVEERMIGHSESLCALIKRNKVMLESEICRHRAAAEAQIQQLRAIVPNVQLVFHERHLMKHVEYLRSAAAERELERSLATFESCNTSNAPFEHLLPHPESDNLGSASPTYWTESMRLHDELVQSHPLDYKAAFHASIYEALADLRDNSSAEYNQKLESLCHNVNPLASIDPVPSGGSGLQTFVVSAPVRAVVVGLPDSTPEQDRTKQAVIEYIEGETKGLASAANKFKRCYHTNKHEVRILCLDYWMPVRYFSFFRYLQREMDGVLLSANEEIKRTVLYYANIDDRNDEKPSLIPPEPIRHNAEFSDTKRPAAPQP